MKGDLIMAGKGMVAGPGAGTLAGGGKKSTLKTKPLKVSKKGGLGR